MRHPSSCVVQFTPEPRQRAPLMSNQESILQALARPIVFQVPRRLTSPPSWVMHAPLAMWLVEALRPSVLVELGTYSGTSYCAFCQAVQQLKLPTKCYAVDTWKGDPHASWYGEEVYEDLRRHHDAQYASFSRLVREDFDSALAHFDDGSIDLLHIDGYHTYDAVKHDFESWKPKLSNRGVVLFHDTNVRERDFGVAQLWEELKRSWPSLEVLHGHGLGILLVGKDVPQPLAALAERTGASSDDLRLFQDFFAHLGRACLAEVSLEESRATIAERDASVDSLLARCTQIAGERDEDRRAFSAEMSRLNQLYRQELAKPKGFLAPLLVIKRALGRLCRGCSAEKDASRKDVAISG